MYRITRVMVTYFSITDYQMYPITHKGYRLFGLRIFRPVHAISAARFAVACAAARGEKGGRGESNTGRHASIFTSILKETEDARSHSKQTPVVKLGTADTGVLARKTTDALPPFRRATSLAPPSVVRRTL